MFRPRRSLSARRLWRRRCGAPGWGQGGGAPPNPEDLHNALRPAALQLFSKLKDEQLWQLAEAVESKGRWESGCIRVSHPGGGAKQAPSLLLCKIYRWPDLRGASELKRLIQCEDYWGAEPESSSHCCNPYHFSRVTPELAAPPSYKIREPPECGALHSTNQERPYYNLRGIHDTTLSRGSQAEGHWCKVAYWEHRSRVGRLYCATEPALHIFHDLPKASGLCLGLLAPESVSEAVRRTRKKIGRGVTLSREKDGVWLYNRSDHPVFINSPDLPPLNARRGPAVHRLSPGYSIKVFDARQAGRISGGSALGEGPSDPHSVRISFAKGWGGCYSRQFITSCPCWLEVLLSTPK